MSDDTPTVRFEQPGEPDLPGSPDADDGRKAKSRTLLIALSILGAVLLIVVVILLTLLFARGMGGPNTDPAADVSTSPSASETPSPSPSETPSETPSASPSASPSAPPPPPPEATGPRFKTFNFPASQSCSAGGPDFPPTIPMVTVSWTTAGADEAWFIRGTDDAASSQYMQIPLNGNQSNFQYEQQVSCSGTTDTYTITLVGPDGKHVSKTWTVNITGDHF